MDSTTMKGTLWNASKKVRDKFTSGGNRGSFDNMIYDFMMTDLGRKNQNYGVGNNLSESRRILESFKDPEEFVKYVNKNLYEKV